jgi:hypothetical protein
MCVIKLHAFIYFLHPPPWSGTVEEKTNCRLHSGTKWGEYSPDKKTRPFPLQARKRKTWHNCSIFCKDHSLPFFYSLSFSVIIRNNQKPSWLAHGAGWAGGSGPAPPQLLGAPEWAGPPAAPWSWPGAPGKRLAPGYPRAALPPLPLLRILTNLESLKETVSQNFRLLVVLIKRLLPGHCFTP